MKRVVGLFLIFTIVILIWGCTDDKAVTNSTDNTPPTVSATYPLSGATEVPIDTVITATFSEDINPSTIAASTFYINGVSGTVTYSDKIATLTPSADLAEGQTYTANITTAVKDEAGNALAQNYTWSFTTEYNSSGLPQVISTSPVDGASGVPVDVLIQAAFSEEMNPSTITGSSFFISSVNGQVSYSGVTATLDPYIDLDYNTEYTAYVLSTVEDIEGNAMAQTYTWTFTTLPDVIMPLVTGNTWKGTVSAYDEDGDFIYSYYDSLKLVGTATINYETYWVEDDGTAYSNQTDGLYRRLPGGEVHLFLKYPVTMLDYWDGDTDLDEFYQLLDVDTTITTPAGTFDCILYKVTFGTASLGMNYYFYSPQYGLIQYEVYWDRTADPVVLKARWVTTSINLN